jgi:hypothetical protein
MNPMHVSSSKIISHLLRSIPVEGEYYLSINNRLMQGEIAPEASAKIHTALFFVEQPPYPFDAANDKPRAPLTEAPRAAREVPLPALPDPNLIEELNARSLNRLYRTRVEVTSGPISSNWSKPWQSSPMLMLDDASGAASAPSS